MAELRASIVDRPLDVIALIAEVAADSNGATAVFVGTVRSSNHGRLVDGIEYTAYREMAEKEMHSILLEASQRFVGIHAVMEHRVGRLSVGDASIAVVVAAPHRVEAMDAVRHIVDQTKSKAPIWKLEQYSDGSREWVGSGVSA